MSGEALTIGEVIGRLAADFPDLTVSKIRYLESGGLISPGRTPAGYRRFTEEDVEKLRWVLAAQRDQYLPLKVIRQHLAADGPRVTAGDADAIVAALTSGSEPAAGTDPATDTAAAAVSGRSERSARWERTPAENGVPGGADAAESPAGAESGRAAAAPDRPRLPPPSTLTPPLPPLPHPRAVTVADPEFFVAARSDVGELHLSRDGLARTAGVSGSFLADLIAYGLVPNAEDYGGDAVIIARAASALTEYGLEPRHLRPLLTGARNTAGLLGTLLPTRRHDGVTGAGRQAAASRAAGRTAEASAAAVKLYGALLRAELAGSGGGAAAAAHGSHSAAAAAATAVSASSAAAAAPTAAETPVAAAVPPIAPIAPIPQISAPSAPVPSVPAPAPPTSADASPTPSVPASRASSRNPGMPGGPASR
ncbi:transcriptional regulator, MerR family [Catenulispora acidiphila DSM 44928]|uniref:Transcriptional regulator, MerR family n=1 Tax=Catenulispora acidiphila (strain DSM 44928 / JCM 14897 / NBRC 102108 / NRRL B-24433 / ID139908) TaxID=479433 RepID=C7Q4R9_CATAD|nr:MerR family transcriptional regulator [Catenulispora acidiphila]ACU72038.1 transcriptional regulator, MerR family [Catenulispora acidiphila DSM 44928]